MDVVFVITNLAITLGYLYVAVFVAPHFKIKSRVTRVSGALFFFTCALTHLHMASDTWYHGGVFHSVTPLSLVIHLVQAVAVWLFVTGLYEQFVVGPRRNDRLG